MKKLKSDKFIILHEAELKKNLELYAQAHKNEASNNYGYYKDIDRINIKDKQNLARYIHNQYDTMDMEEIKKTVLKCLSEKQLRKILLEFELQYYVQKTEPMSLTEFTKKAKEILDRYQCKGGGYCIEDTEWTIHTQASEVCDVKDYEVVFVNSIDKIDKDDNETLCYMKRIVKRLNSLSNNIDVEYRYTDPDDGIVWVEIWCEDTKQKEAAPEISV